MVRAVIEMVLKFVVIVDHRLKFFGVAFDGQHDCPLLDTIPAGRDRRDDLTGIGQAETDGKSAVGAKMNRLALQGHVRVGLGRAIDDKLSIDFEVEVAARAREERRRTGSASSHSRADDGVFPRRGLANRVRS